MERFRPILAEVLLIDRDLEDGKYERLIGYLPLEQAQAAVDLVGHRLVEASRVDLKALQRSGQTRSRFQCLDWRPSTPRSKYAG
jgi:hypothetical protein